MSVTQKKSIGTKGKAPFSTSTRAQRTKSFLPALVSSAVNLKEEPKVTATHTEVDQSESLPIILETQHEDNAQNNSVPSSTSIFNHSLHDARVEILSPSYVTNAHLSVDHDINMTLVIAHEDALFGTSTFPLRAHCNPNRHLVRNEQE